jgi:hypothetical protein
MRRHEAALVTLAAKPFASSIETNAFSLFVDTGGFVNFETDEAFTVSADPIDVDTWHHLAITYDGVTKSVYVDGELAGDDDDPDVPDAFAPIFLGTDVDDGGLHGSLVGDLDDLRFYPRVLAPAELAALAAP